MDMFQLLRNALKTIHSDKNWWHAISIGGLCSLTVFGYPIAAGLIPEHMENTRKGFASPLPPFIDWTTRWLLGLFAALIDFLYYLMPLMVAVLVFFCASLLMLSQGSTEVQTILVIVFLGGMGSWWLLMFLSGVSAVGRLIYVDDSGFERSLTGFPLREALRKGARGYYFKARIASLPLYIAPIICALLLPPALDLGGWIGWIGGIVVTWLFFSSLLYAHVATMLIYHAVDQDLAWSDYPRPQLGE